MQRAVEAVAPAGNFDSLRSVRYSGASFSLDPVTGERIDTEEASRTDILMVFPEDFAAGLFMHSRHTNSADELFERILAGDASKVGGIEEVPPELHWENVRYASTKFLTLLRHRNDPDITKAMVGSGEVEGKAVDWVEIRLEGFPSVLEIERDSGRVLAVRFPSSEVQEEVIGQTVRRAYSDVRQVNGFFVPFAQRVSLDDAPFSAWILDEVVINGEYDDSVFEPEG